MSRKVKQVMWGIVTILIAGVIFYFSHQNGSESDSMSITFAQKIFGAKISIFSESQMRVLNKVVRKSAHFSIFSLLGISVYNFLYLTEIKRPFLWALLLCGLYALSDELHQFFIPRRSPQLTDVAIDVCGSLVGIFLVKFKIKLSNRKYNKLNWRYENGGK